MKKSNITRSSTAQKLVIGFVFDDSLDKGDGVQQYILALGAQYTKLGHEVHYLVGETKRTDLKHIHSLSKNVRVSFNGNKMSMPRPASKKRIRDLFAAHQFDVLHVQMPHSPFLAQRVILAAPASTRIVGTFHILPNSALVTAANKALKLALQPSLRRINAFVSVSPAAQTFFEKSWGIKSVVLPNVVDVPRYASAQPLSAIKTNLNIVFLGRLVERKGCQYLLQAVKQIVRLNLVKESFSVTICGTGPLQKNLQEFVSMNGLKHIVTFVGFVDETQKPQYLSAADIAVFPATGGESFGIVLIEAMAASRGVVLGGDNPGYRSVLGEQEAQLFDPKNNHDFATLLASYLNSAKLRTQAQQWQEISVQQYDIPVVASKLLDLYTV